MEDVIQISDKIRGLAQDLSAARKRLGDFVNSHKLPEALKGYRKKMQITILTLREKGTPVTLVEKIAQGSCAEEEYELELAKQKYKTMLALIETIKAELNGFQSIFRHLEHA